MLIFRRCIELCPDCPLVRTVCANGLLKIPKFADKEFVDECLKFALEKLPHDPAVHHAAGMCAERLEYVNILQILLNYLNDYY